MLSPLLAYQDLVDREVITPDPAQARATEELDKIWHDLAKPKPLFAWLRAPQARPKGIYLHGGVGRGKSMLMDMFFDSLPHKKKRRVHFHAFMQEVHERIFAWRNLERQGKVKGGDPIPPVAREIAKQADILCFDEFQVKDIADASILGRLFTQLFDLGVVMIATSNRHPDDLYKGGLHRDRFLPFIRLLQERLDIFQLDSDRDYRMDRLLGHPMWFAPIGSRAREALDERFQSLTGGDSLRPVRLELKGRFWVIDKAALGVARLRFDDLCIGNRGAADYLALAAQFHTVLIDNIPLLTKDKRNEAVRFVTLIDALYEHRVKLLASADGQASELYPEGDGSFEFQRTVSRLMEMQSEDYLALPHRIGDEDIG